MSATVTVCRFCQKLGITNIENIDSVSDDEFENHTEIHRRQIQLIGGFQVIKIDDVIDNKFCPMKAKCPDASCSIDRKPGSDK